MSSKEISLNYCVRDENGSWYSLTRPPWKSQSSAQHGECVLRRVWDGSPGGGKKRKEMHFLKTYFTKLLLYGPAEKRKEKRKVGESAKLLLGSN